MSNPIIMRTTQSDNGKARITLFNDGRYILTSEASSVSVSSNWSNSRVVGVQQHLDVQQLRDLYDALDKEFDLRMEEAETEYNNIQAEEAYKEMMKTVDERGGE